MPKSNSKPRKAKPASTTHSLQLEHLYDASIHTIGNTTGYWGSVTLPSDLLPRVVAFLDDEDDLATLLVIQQCSTYAWECVTPKIYRSVTVVDWVKFLRLPEGLTSPTPTQFGRPRQCVDPAHVRSMNRRRLAFGYIVDMQIHAFPITLDYFAFRYLTWEGRDKAHCAIKGHEECDRMFPKLWYLEISERAMEPICHGGAFADRWIDNPKSDEYMMHEIFPGLIGPDAHIRAGCIMLPQKPEHTMAYGLHQLIQGNPKYGAPSDSGRGGGMRVVPAKTEDSTVLREVLSCYTRGANVSIHNMTDLWIRMACGHNSVSYNLFYSPHTIQIPSSHGGGLGIYRKSAYLDTLRCEPEHDPTQCKDCGHHHFRATWTVTGEEYYHEDPSYAFTGLHNKVFDLCQNLFDEDQEDEVEIFDEEEVAGPEYQDEVLAGVAPGLKAKVKRMKFVKPGEETPCSFCGRF